MKSFIFELKKNIIKNLIKEHFSFQFYDEDFDENNFLESAYNLAKENNLYISNDKKLTYYVLDGEKLIASLFCSEDNTSFSFDVVVDKEYRNQNLASKLIDKAILIYRENKEIYGDDYFAEIEVVNPLLINHLKKRGFTETQKTRSGIVMGLTD